MRVCVCRGLGGGERESMANIVSAFDARFHASYFIGMSHECPFWLCLLNFSRDWRARWPTDVLLAIKLYCIVRCEND